MSKLLAHPALSNGGNGIKYNIAVEKDDEMFMLGEPIDDIFYKYLEFETQEDAIDYINKDSRLQLDTNYC